METMLNVTVNGTIHQYPYGTTYRAIAAEFQENYPHQILFGMLCEEWDIPAVS